MASASKGKATCISWEDFLSLHRPQLQSIGLPEHLWERLYKKLTPVTRCDASEAFEVRDDEGSVAPGRWSLHAKRALQKFSDVFIVEHVWSSDGASKANEQLQKSPELRLRMREMMHRTKDVEDEIVAGDESLDNGRILTQLGGVDDDTAKEILQSTNGELIEALCQITSDSYRTKKPSKSDESTIMTFAEFKTGFLHAVGMEKAQLLSEEYVQKMYSKYKGEKRQYPESLGFGYGTTLNYSWSEDEEGAMTVRVSIPVNTKKGNIQSRLSTKRWTLGLKGNQPIIDGEFYGNVCPDESFWTFDAPGSLLMTLQKPENEESELWPVLIKGEKHLTEKEISQQTKDKNQETRDEVHDVLESMWYYNQTYQAVTPGGERQHPVWYIMDELGSALLHSDKANVKCSPFAYAATGVFYSLLWPLENVVPGELCTRNFCPVLNPFESQLQRKARLLAFKNPLPNSCPTDFVDELVKFPTLPKENDVVINVGSLAGKAGSANCARPKISLDLKFYLDEKGRKKKQVLKGLGCTFVESAADADAAWLERRCSLGETVRPGIRVNRLKGEENLLVLHLLSAHIRQTWGNVPWFPTSYDLSVHLPAVCADHFCRGVASYWILRPSDQSKLSLRPVVTSDLRRVMRLTEIGQMVASHYCLKTALCKRKVFCLQYAVIVKSLEPIELHIHNVPFVRLAETECNQSSLLDEYDLSSLVTHDSPPNTNSSANQKQITHQEFLKDLEFNYLTKKQMAWHDVQQEIYKSIGKLFYATSPGLSSLQGRESQLETLSAVYGVDVLLKDSLQPLIIGVNPTPSFDNDTSFSEVLVSAFGRNGECHTTANVTQVSLTGNQTLL